MRIVVALGGNAVLARGEPPDAGIQERHVQEAVEALVPLVTSHQLVFTHGNGPQVGLLALESSMDPSLTRPYPLDVMSAQTQGMIGYWVLQALHDELPGTPVAGIITRTLVSRSDDAFGDPRKFVGPAYDERRARRVANRFGWTVRSDGACWRRVVPSPAPVEILEIALIRRLVNSGVTVVCAGGGGIPVARDPAGKLAGVEGVVDKDLTAALLAEGLDAEALLILTDVEAVFADFSTPDQRPIRHASPDFLRSLDFPPGSMGPKVEAACRFVDRTGGFAGIGALGDAHAILEGRAGTTITVTGRPPSSGAFPF